LPSTDNKKKPAERFSILVVPRNGSNIRRFEASDRLFKAAVGGAALLAFFVCASIVAMVFYRSAYLGTEDVRVKAAQFMQERDALISKFSDLEDALARTERFAAKIEAQSGAGKAGRVGEGPIAERETLPGVAGTDEISLGKGMWKSPFKGTLSEGLDLSLDKLADRTARVEGKLHALFSKQQDKLYFWSSLPSSWPTRGWVTSLFGNKRGWGGHGHVHEGIDIAGPRGTPIVAPGDGIVTYAGYKNGYGKSIVIDHGYGISTLYGHCSAFFVEEGQRVQRGSLIAAIGNTGRSTGPHLHFEVRVDGVPVDPMLYLADNS
jgi:murein DD-endopeptidase MepM/ murein hydrolase activator NlpD